MKNQQNGFKFNTPAANSQPVFPFPPFDSLLFLLSITISPNDSLPHDSVEKTTPLNNLVINRPRLKVIKDALFNQFDEEPLYSIAQLEQAKILPNQVSDAGPLSSADEYPAKSLGDSHRGPNPPTTAYQKRQRP